MSAIYNSFRITPDVVGGTNTTWTYEVTVPTEGTWQAQARATDTTGQSALDTADRSWIVSDTANPPTVTITAPVAMTPPLTVPAVTVAPGGQLTFSGTANDDEQLDTVEIQLRNSSTRENLGADGTWGVDVIQGWYRVSPVHVNATSYNWTYTTPFNLTPGTYSFSVRGTDQLGLTTSNNNQGRLTINAQIPGDTPPNTTITPTGTITGLQVLHLDLAGSATDDQGVAEVRVIARGPGQQSLPAAQRHHVGQLRHLAGDAGHAGRYQYDLDVAGQPADPGRLGSDGRRLRHRRPAGPLDQRRDVALPDLPG